MNNRLQFRHHGVGSGYTADDGVFATRDAAITFLKSRIKGKNADESYSLYAEPTVLRYKNEEDETNPHLLLAIGLVTNGAEDGSYYDERLNKFCIIDVDQIEKSIDGIEDKVDDVAKKAKLTVKSSDTIDLTLDTNEEGSELSGEVKIPENRVFGKVVKANSLISDEDGIFLHVDVEYDENNNKIVFTVNDEENDINLNIDNIVKGEYDTKDESIHLVTKSGNEIKIDMSKLIDEWVVEEEYSNTPIVLTRDKVVSTSRVRTEDWQDVLRADIRIDDERPNNILKKTDDGRKVYVEGYAKNIAYYKDGQKITVKDALDELNKIKVDGDSTNIIVDKGNGFYANVTLDYKPSENKLLFDNGKGEVEIPLNSFKLFEEVYYDSETEQLVIWYSNGNGSREKVSIPLKKMINEWGVSNNGHNVSLKKERIIDGKDKLSADVNISDADNNILTEVNHALFVKGTAGNIKYHNGTVKSALEALEETTSKFASDIESVNNFAKDIDGVKGDIDALKDKDAKLLQDLIGEINARTAQANEILAKIEQETKDREHADEDIKHLLDDLKNVLDITEVKEELKKFEAGYAEFEKEWAAYKPQIEKAITDAESVAGRVAKLEQDLAVTNTNLNNLTNRVVAVEGLNDKVNEVSESLTATNGEVSALKDRVVTAEGNINNNASKIADNTLAIANEATLARQNESDIKTALEKEVTRSTAKDEELASSIATNKADIEILKGTTGSLQNDLTAEVERAKGVENSLQNTLGDVKATADKNKSDIATNLQKLNDEITRATAKETEIEGKLNDEVNRAIGEETRLEALINTNKDAIAENKTNIGTISTSVAGLRNELENEVTRAKGEEKRIEDKVDALSNSSTDAANNALEQAKNYTDAEVLKAKTASAEDATAKANQALVDAKTYSDEKLALETARAQAAEQTNAAAITELKAKDAEIEANVAKKVENVRVEKNSVSDLQYILYVDDKPAGEINIPKDQFLKGVRYDVSTKSLVFTWELDDEHPETSVDISDFLTTYEAGDGLQLTENVFSVKLTTANESYLQVTADGIQLVGIDAKFDTKADKADVYTKLEVDNAVEAEAIRAKGEEARLQGAIDTTNGNVTELTGRVADAEGKLNIIQGNSAQEGSIEKALADAKAYADGLNNNEVARATAAEKAAEDNAKAYTDELATKVSANEEAIKTLNGNFAEEGSVANAIYQSKDYTDEKIGEVNAELANKANVSDVYTKEQIDAKGYLTSVDVEGFATKAQLEEETNRAKVAEQTNADAISEVKTTADGNVLEITQLKKDVASLEPNVESTDSVKMTINKVSTGTTISSDIKLDLEKANIIKVSGNGLYAEVGLEYNNAENKLTFTAGGVSKDIQLAGASIVQGGHYESATREIVLTLTDGSEIRIPVSDLFNQLKAINPDNDPVNLVIEHNADGQDTIQANLNISNHEDNLILNSNGTLFASKRATQHVMKLDGIGDDVDVQSAVNTVKKTAETAQAGVDSLNTEVEGLKSDVDGLKSDMNEAKTNITNIQNQLTNIDLKIENQNTKITQLEGSVNTLTSTVNELTGKMGVVEGKITEFGSTIEQMQSDIKKVQDMLGGESGDGESILDRLASIENVINNLIDFGKY